MTDGIRLNPQKTLVLMDYMVHLLKYSAICYKPITMLSLGLAG
jgi:hypothetical protein